MKGYIFTLDAVIGLSILLLLIFSFSFFGYESILPEKKNRILVLKADDLISVLSTLKVYEVQEDPFISNLIQTNTVKNDDLNKTILDLITSFWYAGNYSIAENISKNILSGITNVCINITADNQAIYSSCNTSSDTIAVASLIESGYEVGKPTYGYIARAFLNSILGKSTSSYAYFGGYVGDGNITKVIELPSDASVSRIEMEMNAGNNFNLYLNGNYSGTFTPTVQNMTADFWHVCNTTYSSQYCSYLQGGNNTIQINFNSSGSYIGGGYVRVVYDTSEFNATSSNITTYLFPGIMGLVNLYTSFYTPDNLKSMEGYLHFRSEYPIFLTIGNTSIFSTNETAEQNVYLDNATLAGILDYNYLSGKTVPMRMGTGAFQTLQGTGTGDSILVTDLSGSMEWCSNEPFNEDPHTSWAWKTWWEGRYLIGSWRWIPNSPCDDNAKRNYEIAEDASGLFVDTILNISDNRVGLVDYTGEYWAYNYTRRRWFIEFPDRIAGIEHLTEDKNTLQSHINSMETWWGTCTCCGINYAVDMLNSDSNTSRSRSIVVMSDGETNIACSQQGTGNAKQDAILAGQQACSQDIDVYTVGFGQGADESTLRQIACEDSYYFGSANVTDLVDIYGQIAENISAASFQAQTINVTGNVSENNVLYTDSYLRFWYEPVVEPFKYGEIEITAQTEKIIDMTGYNSTQAYVEGGFYISPNVSVVDAKATSYSSEYWTDNLLFLDGTWISVYSLADYGSDYQSLGDPYILFIPSQYIQEGNINYIRISTGLSTGNTTGGSPDDRVIYTMRVRGDVGYGDVFNSSSLAVSDAKQRLVSQVSSYVDIGNENIEVQNQSISGIQWLWGPSLVKVIVWE